MVTEAGDPRLPDRLMPRVRHTHGARGQPSFLRPDSFPCCAGRAGGGYTGAGPLGDVTPADLVRSRRQGIPGLGEAAGVGGRAVGIAVALRDTARPPALPTPAPRDLWDARLPSGPSSSPGPRARHTRSCLPLTGHAPAGGWREPASQACTMEGHVESGRGDGAGQRLRGKLRAQVTTMAPRGPAHMKHLSLPSPHTPPPVHIATHAVTHLHPTRPQTHTPHPCAQDFRDAG